MIGLLAVDIDWHALGTAALESLIAGLLVCLIAGIAVISSLMASRERERPDGGGGVLAGGYYAITGACVVALVAIIGYGIYLLQK